ncbi:MAG: glycosyltransferase, partial [Myxococcota bacterium]
DDAPTVIRATLAEDGVVAGAFRTRTVDDCGGSWLDPLLPLADLRASYTHLPYGDQALFVRRSAFDRVGGYPDQPLFEDLELARRLWTVGRIAIAPGRVRVSARRYLRHPLRAALAMNTFPVLYRTGLVSVERLARWYAAG